MPAPNNKPNPRRNRPARPGRRRPFRGPRPPRRPRPIRPGRSVLYMLLGIVVFLAIAAIVVTFSDYQWGEGDTADVERNEAVQDDQGAQPDIDVATANPILTTYTWPTSECSGVSTTPIVVGDRLVYSLHDKTLGVSCDEQSVALDSLMSFSLTEKEIQPLFTLSEAEGTALYNAEQDQLFVPLLRQNRPYAIVDTSGRRWEEITTPPSASSIVDSAGVYLDGYYYVGTVNLPMPICQNPFSEDCGAILKIDADSGRVVDKLNAEDGFRGWITGAPTTDGEFLYVGTGAGMWGDESRTDAYACSVVKLNTDLEVIASVDMGSPGCPTFEGSGEEQGVAGEIVLSQDGLWVQYTRPSGEGEPAAIVHYDDDLNEICRVERPTIPTASNAGYYQAPVVDKDGNAYVTWRFIAQYIDQTGVYKITPDCETEQLTAFDEPFISSPTLADDRYLITTNVNTVMIIDIETAEVLHEIELETEADAMTAPVVHDGVIYVLSSDGTLSAITETGIQGYGEAQWPRLRKDNQGTATRD